MDPFRVVKQSWAPGDTREVEVSRIDRQRAISVNGNSAGGVSTSLQQYQNAGVRPSPFG